MSFRTNMKAIKAGRKEVERVKHDPSELSVLIGRREEDVSPDVRALAVMAAHRHPGNADIMKALTDVARDDPHWRPRSALAVSLGEMNTDESNALLKHIAQTDVDERVRSNAQLSIDQLADRTLPLTRR